MDARGPCASGSRAAAGRLACAAALIVAAAASAAPATTAASGDPHRAAPSRPAFRTEPAPAIVFVIPLEALEDLWALDDRRDVARVLDAAGRHSSGAIFITAYVTAGDARAGRSEAADVADRLVVEFGGYLASRGVEPERITGKGVGIDPRIGRAIVVSVAVVPESPGSGERRRGRAPEARGLSAAGGHDGAARS